MSVPTRFAGSVLVALTLVTTPMITPSAGAAERVSGCVAAHLAITRGPRLAATGHRYDQFRITNTGRTTCRLYGYPTFRFRNGAGAAVGRPSQPYGVPAHVVRLAPGQRTRVTVATVDPAVTRPADCRAQDVASVDIALAYRPHVYRLPMTARVCTTRRYRPSSYPVGF